MSLLFGAGHMGWWVQSDFKVGNEGSYKTLPLSQNNKNFTVRPPSLHEYLLLISPHQQNLCNIEHSGGMVPFICYYRKVRSSICISQKPYNGKMKLHWTYTTKVDGLIFPLAMIISTLFDLNYKEQKPK